MTEAILRLLLKGAPEEFRDRYADELLRVHRERAARRRGWLRGALFALGEVVGTGMLVARMRLRERTDGPHGTGTGGRWMMETTWRTIRTAGRTLRRNPGFTLTAVVVVGLGIGATTAIFSAVNAFFFRPLPFAEADRLVHLYETNPEYGWTDAQAAPANFLDWREQVDAFEDIAAYADFVDQVTYIRDGEPLLLSYVNVTGNFFDVLGVRPALGRTFHWEETWQGSDDVVVLSHGLWMSLYGGDPDVVGRTMEFSTSSAEIVGVMPAGFSFPSDGVQLWTPPGWDPANRQATWFRRAHWVRPIARLAPGVDMEEAEARFQVVVRRLQEDYPETNEVMGAGMMQLRNFLIRDVRRSLWILMGAVTVLLLLACTNVANLMLVRASERTREVALRYALGAGRGRVAVQMLTESMGVALLGGALGMGLGWLGVRAIGGLTELGINGATTWALDHRVVAVTLAATVASGLLFGLAPVFQSTRGDVQSALKEGGRGGSEGRGALRGVRTLVAAEVALALLLVVGAGLMLRTFWLLRDADPGFRTENVLAFQISVPSARYQDRASVLAFYDQLHQRLESRGDVERVGSVGNLPLGGLSWSSQFQAEGWPPERVGFDIVHRRADAGYFEALEIPLVRGRMFGPDDGPDDPLVVLVNESFVQEHFPDEDPIGQRIAYDRRASANPEEHEWYEIIGVVGDQHQVSPGVPPEPEVFESRDQDWSRTVWHVVRTDRDPLSLVPEIRAEIQQMDPLIPLARVRALREVWRSSMAREELILVLLGAFGAVALVLAAVGVWGVTAQAARKRTQEIGIRMALGADGSDVVGLMLRQGLAAVGVGLLVGLGLSLMATRALESLLYQVEPNDPWTLGVVVGTLAAVATAACYLPARRATRVDPVKSLRAE